MKVINANVVPNSYASMYLQCRRHYRSLNTATIKRLERRKARHELDGQIKSDLHDFFQDVRAANSRMLSFVHEAFSVKPQAVPSLTAFAAEPAQLRDVIVVRKPIGARARKEIVLVPVMG